MHDADAEIREIVFTSTTRRFASGGTSSSRPTAASTALLTQTSILPKCSTARRASSSTLPHSATSVGTARALPPRASHSVATPSGASSERAARTTEAPRWAKCLAAARPMPRDAPVITTTILSALVRALAPPGVVTFGHIPREAGPCSGLFCRVRAVKKWPPAARW
jgi:hypothetical protein